MDSDDIYETPLSLYSYGVLPTAKQDLPYAGAGLQKSNVNSNTKLEKLSTMNEPQQEHTLHKKPVARPRSSSSCSLNTARSQPSTKTVKKLPAKTVAFGLTTNVEDTIEKSRPIPLSVNKRLSAFRGSNSNLATKTTEITKAIEAPTKDTAGKMKAQITNIESIKNENRELKKSLTETQADLSNLRQILMNISSRLLELESHKHNCVRAMAEFNLNRSHLTANIDASPSLSPLNDENDENMCANPIIDNEKIINNQTSARGDDVFSRQPKIRETEHSSEIQPYVRKEDNNDKNDDLKKLLTVIENRIRQEPRMLQRAKQLFCGPIQNSPVSCANLNSNFMQDVPVSVVEEKIPGVAPRSGNPYNAKFTQKMTVERSEVITYTSRSRNSIKSKQIGAIRGNPTHMQISGPQQVRKSETRRAHPALTTNDDEFFEQVDGDFNSNDPSFNDNDNHYYPSRQEFEPFIEEMSDHHCDPYRPEENQISRRERRERYRKR